MSQKEPILTDNAPKPLPGIYSQAIKAGGFVYCSGQIPASPETKKVIDGDIQAHTVCRAPPLLRVYDRTRLMLHQVFMVSFVSINTLTYRTQHQCIKNLGAVLEAAGSSLEKVVEVNVFLADMDDFAKMNEVYVTYFGEPKPART